MPAQTARRGSTRHRHREPSEEQIEEEEVSQRSRAEDVEEDDEEPSASAPVQPRKSKKSKTTESKQNGAQLRPSEEEEEDVEQDEAVLMQIDIENFQDQPLSKAAKDRIVPLAKDWREIQSQIDMAASQLLVDVGVALAEAAEARDGEQARHDLEKIDIRMRGLIDTNAEMKAYEKTLDEIANDLARDEAIDNVVQRLVLGVEDKLEAWGNKSARQKYAKDENYIKFKQSIYEVQYPEQGMPPMNEFIPAEDGDQSDDDDIEVGGASQVYTCPLTLTALVKPVTSQVCNHSFSRAAIEDYFGRDRSTRKRCPATGCSKAFSLGDLQPNADLENKVQQHLRRERRRQAEAETADDNDDEVIE